MENVSKQLMSWSKVEATLWSELLLGGINLEIEILVFILEVVFGREEFVDYVECEFVNLLVLK